MRRCFPGLVAVIATLLLAGCAGPAAAPAPPAPEHPVLRVRVLDIVDTATFRIAQQRGYFAAEGLQVQPVVQEDATQALGALRQGQLDIAFVNYAQVIGAQQAGAGRFRVIADAYQAGINVFPLLVRPDGLIRQPRDLTGKRLAVSTPGNVNELTARAALELQGVDPNSVRFVQVPFPQMEQALTSGQVDGALMVEPFATASQIRSGFAKVLDTASGPTAELAIAGYATTDEFARADPATVSAFGRAMSRAAADAAQRATVDEALRTYLRADPETILLLKLGAYPLAPNALRIQRVADLMQQFGQLPGRFDAGSLVDRF